MEHKEIHIADLFGGYMQKFNVSKKDQEQYAYYVNEARKLTGDDYMKMHRRITRAFVGLDSAYVIRKLKEWVHEAEKADNKGWTFNTRFKQWREKV